MSAIQILDSSSPQYVGLSKKVNELVVAPGQNSLGVLQVEVIANASAGFAFTVPFDCRIVDAQANCSANNALGTLQVRINTTAITSAIVCAVVDTIARGTVANAQKDLKFGTTYNVLAGGTDATATRGIVTLYVIKN